MKTEKFIEILRAMEANPEYDMRDERELFIYNPPEGDPIILTVGDFRDLTFQGRLG